MTGLFDVGVLGGGIAGLSAAWHLSRWGAGRICVVERDWTFGVHASGSNSAIFRQYDGQRRTVRLARRSLELMAQLEPKRPLVTPAGAVYFGGAAASARLRAALEAEGAACSRWEPPASHAARITLAAGEEGIHVPGDGLIDVHAMIQALVRALRDAGAELWVREEAVAIDRRGLPRVQLSSGRVLEARRLVLAGGAWSQQLGQRAGLEVPFLPRRRHLVYLKPPQPLPRSHPIVWDTHAAHEVYFRVEAGGVLASPCDSTAWRPELPPVDPQAVVALAERLQRLSPRLAEAEVVRSWACLRTFAPDDELVAGRDPRDPRFTWCAGLGGRGMTCGLAVGEIAAAAALGRPVPGGGAPLSPARLLDRRRRAATCP